MSDRIDRRRLSELAGRARPYAGRALLVLLGFGLGASSFALRSCGSTADHADHAQRTSVAEPGRHTVWTCVMHPQIRQSEPGRCPICGMELVPVSSGEGDSETASSNRVVLSERARALARLRTQPVRREADASAEVHLLGRLEPDETSLRTVTAWTGGRIDRLRVNVTGQRVRAGQVIATLYSPEVFAAHQDLLVAKRQVARMTASPESSRLAARAALDAARERLRLLGVPDAELARMEEQEQPTRAVAIRSPFAGTVIERLATEGAYVTTGTPLYRVANLGTLWVQLDAYERDLPLLSVGQPVRISVEGRPDEEFDGRVTFIDPTVDARRRTAQVRVQVDNGDGRLRPGMFAEATVSARESTEGPSPLVVPATAPLFTGRRAVVYVEVATPDGVSYEARTVRLGPRLGDVYPVVAGLSEGDRVVTRGAFALDADLQIRGGASMMAATDDRAEGTWDRVVVVTPAARRSLAPIVTSYLDVQEALAGDDLGEAARAATAMADAVRTAELDRPADVREAWSSLSTALTGHARHVAMASDLEGARQGFEALSGALVELLARFGNPLERSLRLAFCPMASGSRGAYWIQEDPDVRNPYFGAAMPSCGEIRRDVAPGAYLEPPATATESPRPATPSGGHVH